MRSIDFLFRIWAECTASNESHKMLYQGEDNASVTFTSHMLAECAQYKESHPPYSLQDQRCGACAAHVCPELLSGKPEMTSSQQRTAPVKEVAINVIDGTSQLRRDSKPVDFVHKVFPIENSLTGISKLSLVIAEQLIDQV